jgi:mRNA interferase MazF
MRPIHIAQLDKARPVLVLTREAVRPYLSRVSVAPITSTIRGLSTEVPVGRHNGLDHESVVSCDNIVTVPAVRLGRHLGHLLANQQSDLADAIQTAFHLARDVEGWPETPWVR